MNVKEQIKNLRKNHLHLTQNEFSRQINISRSNLGNIEAGLVNVTDRVIFDICEAFDINVNWLRTGEGEMYRQKTRDESIVEWAAKITRDDYPNEFAKRFANVLTKLEDTEWAVLEKIALYLLNEQSKKNNQG